MRTLAKMNETRRILVDIETTGLDYEEGRILEVALIITNERFNEIDRQQWVVDPRSEYESMRDLKDKCDHYVHKMHTHNQLFKEIEEGFGHELSEVEGRMIDMITDHGAQKAPLCGSSVHFDRAWLEAHMPRFAELLHYRNVDASGLRIVAESGGAIIDVPQSAHRAMSDLERSLEIVRQCRDGGKGWRGILHHLKAIVRILRRM